MKGLVVGGGSIGGRHLDNLGTLGVEHLALVEPNPARLDRIAESSRVAKFHDLASGLDWMPDFVVIATPSHLHAEQALKAARRGIDLFVEKPLSHRPGHLAELVDLVRDKKLISLAGCNMRFHPGPAKVKELLSQNRLGKILFSRIQVGSYLPDWRPTQDYRNNYAAREEAGGGCILDCIHEIDLARWLMGEVVQVFCCAGHLSSLEIATEDVAALIGRHDSGAVSEIHLDYVQRSYQRDIQIAGELGQIFWDFNQGKVRWFDAGNKQWTDYTQPEQWQVNDMYVEEMKHFLDCVMRRTDTLLPIPEAAGLMQVVFAATSSAQCGSFVSVGETPA